MRLRVRYGECDAQGIVFNARWGDYVDVGVTEYLRAAFEGAPELDMRLRKQTVTWHSPARYDEVLELRVRTLAVGTTSFMIATEVFRGDTHLASCETVYVAIELATGAKRAVPEPHRTLLARGAPGITIDQSGVRT